MGNAMIMQFVFSMYGNMECILLFLTGLNLDTEVKKFELGPSMAITVNLKPKAHNTTTM